MTVPVHKLQAVDLLFEFFYNFLISADTKIHEVLSAQ